MKILPRGTCGRCKQQAPVLQNGTLRKHKRTPGGRQTCSGSGTSPVPRERAGDRPVPFPHWEREMREVAQEVGPSKLEKLVRIVESRHNLRALVLRSYDREPLTGCPIRIMELADNLKLDRTGTGGGQTDLGREVAERVRPKPWRWVDWAYILLNKEAGTELLRPGEEENGIKLRNVQDGETERIADLLTADDLARAKAWGPGDFYEDDE